MSYTALGSAIYSLVDAATTLKVYQDRAPQGGTPPYVIFQRQDAQDQYAMNSKPWLMADYVVKVVSAEYAATTAQAQYETVHAGIQNGGTVTVTGYNLLRFQRQATIQYQEPAGNGGFWHVGGIYRVDIWEA